jgi:hypothetical protein
MLLGEQAASGLSSKRRLARSSLFFFPLISLHTSLRFCLRFHPITVALDLSIADCLAELSGALLKAAPEIS